jgi:hypothetical protein
VNNDFDSAKNVPDSGTAAPSPEEIGLRARSLWEEAGRPEGRDVEHWLAAERELRARACAPTTSPKSEYVAGPPAAAGNPAYPSLEERAAIVAGNKGSTEPVQKLPASKLSAAGRGGAKPEPDTSAPMAASKRGTRRSAARA